MEYVLEQDELYFMCMISGATSLLGVEDVAADLNEEELKSKWERVSDQLCNKGMIAQEN